jgi:hypothetical protein
MIETETVHEISDNSFPTDMADHLDHAMVLVVSHQPLTVEAQVHNQVSPRGIFDG